MVKWRLGGDGDEVTDMLRQELEEALIGWSTARDSVEYEERLVEFVSLCLQHFLECTHRNKASSRHVEHSHSDRETHHGLDTLLASNSMFAMENEMPKYVLLDGDSLDV